MKTINVKRISPLLLCFLLFILFGQSITMTATTLLLPTVFLTLIDTIAIALMIRRRTTHRYAMYSAMFALYSLLITVTMQHIQGSVLVYRIPNIVTWCLIIVLMDLVDLKGKQKDLLIYSVTVFTAVMSIILMINYVQQRQMRNWGYSNSCYYVICALPIVMMCRAKKLRIMSILLITAAAVLSLKRTAVIAVGASFSLVFMYHIRTSKHFGLKALLIVALLIGAVSSYDVIVKFFGVDLFSRFSEIQETGGSERATIFQGVLQTIWDRPIFENFFGVGYNGYIEYYGSTVSAHNDFLEMVIDYGVIGLTYYIYIIANSIKGCFRNKITISKNADALITSIVVFITMSMFSHLYLYPTFFYYLLIFWSVARKQTAISE